MVTKPLLILENLRNNWKSQVKIFCFAFQKRQIKLLKNKQNTLGFRKIHFFWLIFLLPLKRHHSLTLEHEASHWASDPARGQASENQMDQRHLLMFICLFKPRSLKMFHRHDGNNSQHSQQGMLHWTKLIQRCPKCGLGATYSPQTDFLWPLNAVSEWCKFEPSSTGDWCRWRLFIFN